MDTAVNGAEARGKVRTQAEAEEEPALEGVSPQTRAAEPRNARPLPQLADVEVVSTGWINKYIVTYVLPDGTPYSYESASRRKPGAYRALLESIAAGKPTSPDAVCMVPILPDGSLLLIREFRYPLNSWCIAFPAGLMEPGEDIVECVARELREETGYALRADMGEAAVRIMPQAAYSSTGMTDETVQVTFAYVEEGGAAQPEPSELIEPFVLPRREVAHFLETNTTPIGTRCQLVLGMIACLQVEGGQV